MSFKGTLDTVSLTGIIQLLCEENKSGLLRVKKNKVEYQIILLKGNIVYAVKPFRKDLLGEMLLEDGLISEADIKHCLLIAKVKKQALGKILFEKKFISEEILTEYLYRQLEDILFNLFLWDHGEFDYRDMQVNLKWLMVVKVNTLQLIMNAARRVDEALSENDGLNTASSF